MTHDFSAWHTDETTCSARIDCRATIKRAIGYSSQPVRQSGLSPEIGLRQLNLPITRVLAEIEFPASVFRSHVAEPFGPRQDFRLVETNR